MCVTVISPVPFISSIVLKILRNYKQVAAGEGGSWMKGECQASFWEIGNLVRQPQHTWEAWNNYSVYFPEQRRGAPSEYSSDEGQ